MKRRAFIRSFSFIFLPFIQARSVLAQSVYEGLAFSDSENTDPAVLNALSDTIMINGGVVYAA